MKAYRLDTGTDGYDEILFGKDEEEVIADVLAHHELDELPAHWSLDDLSYSPAAVAVMKRIHKLREREALRRLPQQRTYERLDQLESELDEAVGEELDQIHNKLDQLEEEA